MAEVKGNAAWNAKTECGKFSFGHGYLMRAIPKVYTANVYRALQGLCRFSLLWGNPVILTDCREIL